MKRSRFTEEQIILREQEAGAKTADVCRGTASASRHSETERQVRRVL